MENLSHPSPPNQRWENGAFWLLCDFILDLGGWGFAVPFYFVQDCWLKFTIRSNILSPRLAAPGSPRMDLGKRTAIGRNSQCGESFVKLKKSELLILVLPTSHIVHSL